MEPSGPEENSSLDSDSLAVTTHPWGERIRAECPLWSSSAEVAFDEMLIAVRLGIDRLRHDDAAQSTAVLGILTQAANEFRDLLVDVSCGRGRTAMRTARALIEQHVAALDVAGNTEDAERWLDSVDAADALFADLQLPEQRLQGKAVKAYRHRIGKRSKNAARRMNAAVQRWGNRFRLGWNPANLKDRSEAHGLSDAYQFYRIASAPVHASAAGGMGLIQQRPDGPTIRTGVAIEPAPLAMLYGTNAMRGILEQVAVTASVELPGPLDALRHLDDAWPELYAGLFELDNDLWPVEAPVNRAVLVLHRSDGDVSFFEYLPDLHRVRPMPDENLVAENDQHPAIAQVSDTLARQPHGNVAVFIHEAHPEVSINGDVSWVLRPDLELDAEIHITIDGQIEMSSDDGTLGRPDV